MIIFSMQLRAIVLILLIIIVRSLFLYKLPKKVFLGLWAIVIARLLIPYSQNFSLGFPLPHIDDLWFFLMNCMSMGTSATTTKMSVATFNPLSIPQFWGWIWLLGCIAFVFYFIVGHMKGRGVYRFAYPVESEVIYQWINIHKIQRDVKVLYCPELTSALTYGIFHPVILLPTTMKLAETEQLNFVLSHEFNHIKHFDVLWKWCSTLVLCLYWYNPMVWIMYILLSRDIELHCDECVLKDLRFTKKNKTAYAMTLLELAEKKNSVLPLVNYFSISTTEERILSIMHSQYVTPAFIVLVWLAVIFIAVLTFVTFMMETGIAFTFPLK